MMSRSSNTLAMLLGFLFLRIVSCQLELSNIGPRCDPRLRTCSPLPALNSSQTVDFTRGVSSLFSGYPVASNGPSYNSSGACFNFRQQDYDQLLASSSYIMFGRVKVVARNHLMGGLASAVLLGSDLGDGISLLWRGDDSTTQVETNLNGRTPWVDPNRILMVADGRRSEYHTYEIEWSTDYISWKINERQARTILRKDTSNSGSFPQTPMQLRIGIWAKPLNDNSDWWGGTVNWTSGPFSLIVRSVELTDYSSGQSYSYGDTSGSLASIRSQGGVVNTTGFYDSASSSSTTGIPTSSPTDNVQLPEITPVTSQDLSIPEKGGIAVGASVGGVGILALIVIWWTRETNRRKPQYRAITEPGVSVEEPGCAVESQNYVTKDSLGNETTTLQS